MKVMMTLLALLLTVGMNAQKIDQRLTQLVEKSAQRRAQGAEPLDPKAVNKSIAVSFNADGAIASFSGIAILKETCVNDTWTTEVANIPSGNKIQAGYGKIDALAGLKKILGTTAIDIVPVDGHRQATPATMYSVDAPVYNMMGQQVDKSHRGFVIYKGRKYLNK